MTTLWCLALLAVTACAQAAFPGRNGRIAFDMAGEIFSVRPDGSGLMNVTRNPAADGEPAWSPDGKSIAFTSERTGHREIYVMAADGTAPRRLTATAGSDSAPTWSPDGRQITFVRSVGRSEFLYSMAPDGSGQSPLTPDPLATGAVAWSPDGDRLAFLRYRVDPTGVWDLVTMRPDGSDPRVLRRLADGSGWGVDWSPNGRLVVFDEVGPTPDDGFQVFVMGSRGGTATMLTHREVASTQPAWSPDGRRIAFQADDAEGSRVYTMSADGSNVKVLAPAGDDQNDPDWQPVPRPPADGRGGAPVLSSVSLRPRRFAPRPRQGRRGAMSQRRRKQKRSALLRFRLSERAHVHFLIERPRRRTTQCRQGTSLIIPTRRCRRHVRIGGFTRSASAGHNRLRFRGRIAGRTLRPDHYRLTLRARDAAGKRSRARRVPFTITRR